MLKELEDYNWFPAILRRWQMEFIGTVANYTQLYKPLVPVIDEMIIENNITALQDTCSGSGMPAVYIQQQLAVCLPMQLTDKFPDKNFKNTSQVMYSPYETDIVTMQPQQNILYTMFNAFHHFSAAQQKQIVQNFATHKTSFVIAEILEPGFINVVKIFLTGTVGQLLLAPFIKPFSFARLFFTYIVPVNLFTVTYDGIISVYKSKTVKQYEALLPDILNQQYHLSVHTIKNFKGNLVYIKGSTINS